MLVKAIIADSCLALHIIFHVHNLDETFAAINWVLLLVDMYLSKNVSKSRVASASLVLYHG